MKQKIKDMIRHFEYMFSIAGIIVAISVYYYWKIFGQEELIKNILGWVIGAGLIVPLVTLFIEWEIRK